MLVFIDESGDPGMKGKSGTSDYFIITAVVFEDHDEATRCDERIGQLKLRLLPCGGEFHFDNCARDRREQFLVETGKFEYFYFTFAFNKSRLYGDGFQYRNSFYRYAVNLLFENLKPHLNHAIVVFDRCGNRDFQKELKKYLTRYTETDSRHPALIQRIKAEESHSNNLLQLADMVCGAAARFLRRDKKDRYLYRKIISHREMSLRIWPR